MCQRLSISSPVVHLQVPPLGARPPVVGVAGALPRAFVGAAQKADGGVLQETQMGTVSWLLPLLLHSTLSCEAPEAVVRHRAVPLLPLVPEFLW
jgi:hypothetical protein